jgi:GR25 family glycosyltransferase involved in LPS biosynthesis
MSSKTCTVGITYDSSKELFYSGANQTAITLSELLQKLGYIVLLLDTNLDTAKCDTFPNHDILFSNLYDTKDLNVLIDIDGFVNPSFRKKIAKTSIVFLRTFLQFSEMDKSVYPEVTYKPRDFAGVSEIWCWDILNPVETLDSIQALFACPIRRVPFIWSPTAISAYKTPGSSDDPLEIHIAEKNNNNTSSSIIPLVAIRELGSCGFQAKYKCHNMKHLLENKFLVENVLNNIEISNYPVEFVDKEPFYKWSASNIVLFSHSRFIPLRIGLLNALWLNIPTLHNSPILKDLHPSLDELYYTGNSISEAVDKLMRFCENGKISEKWLWNKQVIIDKWGIEKNLVAWKGLCKDTFPSVTLSVSLSPPDVPLSPTDSSLGSRKQLTIAFSDMWPGFNYNNNFIIDALRHESTELEIIGQKYTTESHPNLLIFGPYSHSWKLIPDSIPKVYFSAENWTAPTDNIALFLTASRTEDEKHIRIPTWATFIDWFSGSKELPTNTEDNPIRIPLHFAMNTHSVPFETRKEFCAFVVSNPICNFRNETFKALNAYKPVNSGGGLYNNIGGQLSLKYPGGGCGDISKHLFFADHKFTISFENSKASGYITEKLLHAKMAGCVPLYWGDSDAHLDFVGESFINLSNFHSADDIVNVIKKLEDNTTLLSKIAATPILDEKKKELALVQISKMAKKLISLANNVVKKESDMPEHIDKIFLINLDTRPDRLEKLMNAEPYLKDITTRIPGVNGKTLKMNEFIYKLFDKNQFQWKKSVIGCNLSHITTWSKILSSPGKYFLVLEDDVRFVKDWRNTWKKCAEHIPADADILYLGGVLPPNKRVLPECSENVNDYWCKIKPNTYFSSKPSTVFHFCAYSYILTKQGAQKIMDYLTNSDLKSYTISDHLLGSPHVGLNKYFTNPLLSYCFQEDDPVYLNSQFNDLHRQDTFDSDIWNNKECFTPDELAPFTNPTDTIYYIDDTEPQLYERDWLEEILPKHTIEKLPNSFQQIKPNAWFLIQRNYQTKWKHLLDSLTIQGIPFNILHLSDEFGVGNQYSDDISFYSTLKCNKIVRNYWRPDIPNLPNILTIPLGYHHKGTENKEFKDRKLVWSFHGNTWFNRKEHLDNLQSLVPHTCHFIDKWNSPSMTKKDKYIFDLSNSKFCPILRGNNVETFRLYEALEIGCIPIYVRQDGDELFWKAISKNLDITELKNWNEAVSFINEMLDNPEKAEVYRNILYRNWNLWKNDVKHSIESL